MGSITDIVHSFGIQEAFVEYLLCVRDWGLRSLQPDTGRHLTTVLDLGVPIPGSWEQGVPRKSWDICALEATAQVLDQHSLPSPTLLEKDPVC
jgi:hypothetical protein